MANVAVVTDSTQYLPPDVIAANELHVVSLYLNMDGETTREIDITDYADFYRRLGAAERLPTTSQPSIGDFLGAFEPLLDDGRDVACVVLSGAISGTAESARQAAATALEGRPERRIEVVDSHSACGGLGIIVLAAAAAARGGANVGAVAERARAAKADMGIWFAVDTLEYLRRGGRIGAAQAWLGGALKVKPILTIDGEITPVERVRTAGRAFGRLVDFAQERKASGRDAWAVQHIQAPDEVGRLIDRGREIFGSEPMFVGEVGPVIGSHVGPGLLGIAGLPPALMQP